MISNLLKKTAIPTLSRHLDVNGINRRVIAHNLANVNTVGYQKKELVFQDALRDSMQRLRLETTQPGHRTANPEASVVIRNSPDRTIKNGVNNVDVDEEMVELAKNQMEFNVSATILSRIFKSLKSCIEEKASA